MPRTFQGLLAWVLSTTVVVFVGLFIINRVPPLKRLLNG